MRKYARIRPPIRYSGHSYLFLDGVELGPVPALVLGRAMYEDSGVWLIHCDRAWRPLAAQTTFLSMRSAELRAEQMYPGVSKAWIDTKTTKDEALRYEQEFWKDQKCSFCGRVPPQYDAMIGAKMAVICNLCVIEFHHDIETGPKM